MPNKDNKKGKSLRKEESLQISQNEDMKALLTIVQNNMKHWTCSKLKKETLTLITKLKMFQNIVMIFN